MKWITATDLESWADRLDSRGRLPELIRRLIHATVESPLKVDFRSEEGVQLAGWDGTVVIEEKHPYVPSGRSGWELGTGQRPKEKAESDYEKRTVDSASAGQLDTTFVFVSPRRWQGKDEWVRNRVDERKWLDVRAYDADDLEQWLELAPAVSAWLAAVLGKYPPEVQSLEDFWREFSACTNPPMPKDLLTAGRTKECKQVNGWLSRPASPLTIGADSAKEALAFFAATLLSMPKDEADRWLSRAVATDNVAALRGIASGSNPLVICWLSEDESAIGAAISRGHHVVIPNGGGRPRVLSKSSSSEEVLLQRVPQAEFVGILTESGLPKEKAEFLSRETARSIPVLLRRIPASGIPPVPKWAKPEEADKLKPMLLAGSWLGSRDDDRKALSSLGAVEYSTIESAAGRWALEADAPVQRVGEEWSLVSPMDAWHMLSRTLTGADLNRFREVALTVLTEEDPSSEIAPNDRWFISSSRESITHSRSLRAGLAQTLCLLATVAQDTGVQATGRPRDYSDRIVSSLLSNRVGWKRWFSLSDLLPLLAEASPEIYLLAIEDAIASEGPELAKLFDEDFFAHSAHTGLLWSLECLAWFPSYLSRAALVLAKLARLDPGGKLGNRPDQSLRGIFLGWRPQTSANLEQRNNALDLVVSAVPEIGWRIMLELMPKGSDFLSPSAVPRWRERPPEHQVTMSAYVSFVNSLVARALRASGSNLKMLKDLVVRMAGLPPDGRTSLIERVSEAARLPAEDLDRSEMWQTLQHFVNMHRKFSDAGWALPEQELLNIDLLVALFRPNSVVEQFKWLFNDLYPDLPDDRSPWSDSDQKIESVRSAAIRKIFDAQGVGGICSLAESVKYPVPVGFSAAGLESASAIAEEMLDATLGSSSYSLRSAGVTFMRRLVQVAGGKWAEEMRIRKFAEWPDSSKASFLLGLPVCRDNWRVVADSGPEVQRLYWTQVMEFDIPRDGGADAVEGIDRLLAYDRPVEALRVISHPQGVFPTKILLRTLSDLTKKLESAKVSELHAGMGYEVGRVLAELRLRNDISTDDLIRLEWLYGPIMPYGSFQYDTMHSALADDPKLFSSLISFAFRSKKANVNQPPEESITEQERRRAAQAYSILSSWKKLPGTLPEGRLDAAILSTWVDGVREICSATGHSEIADQQIGQTFAHSAPDTDGLWPTRSVRDIIERLESRNIEIGLRIEVLNGRGVTWRNSSEGGVQERTLAQTYRDWSDRTASQWPRTSALLLSLASSYESMASIEDDSAQQWDRRA